METEVGRVLVDMLGEPQDQNTKAFHIHRLAHQTVTPVGNQPQLGRAEWRLDDDFELRRSQL